MRFTETDSVHLSRNVLRGVERIYCRHV